MRRGSTPFSAAVAATAIVMAGLATSACEDLLQEPDTGFSKLTLRLEEVSGDEQTGTAGEALTHPVRVQLLTGEEVPLSRLRVAWTVLDGSGRAEPRDTFTDENGFTEATWILGPAAQRQKLRAVVTESVFVEFSATAVAP